MYELVVIPNANEEVGVDESKVIMVDGPLDEPDTWRCAKQPDITKVSRQLRSKTLPIYYGMNKFLVHCYFDTGYPGFERSGIQFHQQLRWMKAMGKINLGMIRSLEICHQGYDRYDSYLPQYPNVMTASMAYFEERGLELPNSAHHTTIEWEMHPPGEMARVLLTLAVQR